VATVSEAAFSFLASIGALPVSSTPSANCTVPPPPTVPEAPGGRLVLLVGGVAVLGLLTLVRRCRGATTTAISSLALVMAAGALLGMIAAGAASAPCGSGAVLGTSTSATPLTWPDIPWITGAVLVSVGILLTVPGISRRWAWRPVRKPAGGGN